MVYTINVFKGWFYLIFSFVLILGVCGYAEIINAQAALSGEVDLVWETDTYVPEQFNKLKPLITQTAPVKVVAWPDIQDNSGNTIAAHNLYFEWNYNGRLLSSRSGYGQNVLNLQSVSRPDRINVVVKNNNNEILARNSVTLPIDRVDLKIYPIQPLYGPLTSITLPNQFSLRAPDLELWAIPFYAPQQSEHGLRWRVGDRDIFNEKVTITPGNRTTIQAAANYHELLLGESRRSLLIQFR